MYHEDIPVLLDSCLGLPMLSLFQRCKHSGPHISIPKSVPDPSHWAFTSEVLRCARSVLGEPCQASPPPSVAYSIPGNRGLILHLSAAVFDS